MRRLLFLLLLPVWGFSQSTIDVEATYGYSATDNESIIETALAAADGTGNTLVFSGKTWTVQGRVNKQNIDNFNIVFEEGFVLEADPLNFPANDVLFEMWGWRNVNIYGYGATFTRKPQADDTSEFGHGISLADFGGSRDPGDINIYGLTVDGSTGDGIFVRDSYDVLIQDCRFTDNWRQGTSIIKITGDLTYKNCIFDSTDFKAPRYGVDIEPNTNSEYLTGTILFENCIFYDNQGSGFGVDIFKMDNSGPTNIDVQVKNSLFYNNATNHPYPQRAFEFFNNGSDTDNGGANPIAGTVLFQKVGIDGSETGVFMDRSSTAMGTTLEDVVGYQVSSAANYPALGVWGNVNSPAGNVVFDGVYISMAGDEHIIELRYGSTTNITGDIVAVSSFGKWIENYNGVEASNTYTIDQNTSLPTTTVTVAATSAVASKDGTDGEFTFTRSSTQTDYPLMVRYSLEIDSVEQRNDIELLTGMVIIPKDSTTATVPVYARANGETEPDREINLTIEARSGHYSVGSPSTATVVLQDAATGGDVTAPTVNSGPTVDNVTQSSFRVTWGLNEGGTGQIEYGTTTGYGSTTTLETGFLTTHIQTIGGLSPGTEYHYRVIGEDASGNAYTGSDNTQTTSGELPLIINMGRLIGTSLGVGKIIVN